MLLGGLRICLFGTGNSLLFYHRRVTWFALYDSLLVFDASEKREFYTGSYPPNCWRGIFTLVPIPRGTLNWLKEPS
jgi:hypothetical protein